MILGLDVSTSCTGWCVLTENGSLVSMGTIDLSKKKSTYSKGDLVRSVFHNLLISHTISKVYVEENLQAFRSGFSSAKTLSTLARFNGIVSFIAYEVFCVEPTHINVNAARKSLGIKIIREKICGVSTKDQVLKWVGGNLSNHKWPTKVLKSGPRKGQEILSL